ncbi:hypothetical protein [Paraburkholderia sp. J12]|nr:hypothetical protein [Paraburkholderia sp. J12]
MTIGDLVPNNIAVIVGAVEGVGPAVLRKTHDAQAVVPAFEPDR